VSLYLFILETQATATMCRTSNLTLLFIFCFASLPLILQCQEAEPEQIDFKESIFGSVEARHHIMKYSLPRIGLSDQDCYMSLYHEELDRDLQNMKKLGVKTILLGNPWSYGVNIDHTGFFDAIVRHEMFFVVTVQATIYQIELRGGEREFQETIFGFAMELEQHSDVKPWLKGVNIQYELLAETALFFFNFVDKVKYWMDLALLEVPLFSPWIIDVSLEAHNIETQLLMWNSANFDAWIVQLFTPGEISHFISFLAESGTFLWDTRETITF
jgi:hypothetical protein